MCTSNLYSKVNKYTYWELLKFVFLITFYLLLILFFIMFFIFLLDQSLLSLTTAILVLLADIYISTLLTLNITIHQFNFLKILLSIMYISIPSVFILLVISSILGNVWGFSSFAILLILLLYTIIFIFKKQIRNLERIKDSYKEIATYVNSNHTALVLNRSVLHDLAILVSVLDGAQILLKNRNLSSKEKRSIHEMIFVSVEKIRDITQSAYALLDGNISTDRIEARIEVEKIIRLLKNKFQYESISVSLRDESDGIDIIGDRVVFGRIFLNIFLNAIEELERSTKKRKEIEILIKVSGRYLVVEVKDNGSGLEDSKVVNREIPLRENSSKRKYRIGSGLLFCNALIKEKFDGYMRISSKKSEYTKISLFYRI